MATLFAARAMSTLIHHLQHDHAQFLAAIERIRDCGYAHAASWVELGSLRGAMIGHLLREEQHLYPGLLGVAGDHPILRDMVARYRTDLDTVAGAVFAFFRKHSADHETPGFAADLEQLCARLAERIRKEEAMLYPTYARLVASGEITEPDTAAA